VWVAGNHEYTTVMGASKRVRGFTASREKAWTLYKDSIESGKMDKEIADKRTLGE
jgi:hypothetical protein